MQVLVIGCGLAGLTTAHYLRELGARVTVIDRAEAPVRETSFANGSLLTPSMADPWNSPGIARQLFRSIGRQDASVLLRLKSLPSLVGWGLSFLRHASQVRFEAAYLNNVRLAQYSQSTLSDLLQDYPIDFQYSGCGTIKLFSDTEALARAQLVAHWLAQVQISHQRLTPDELVELEPALADSKSRFVGAVRYTDDAVGNARLFGEGLREVAEAAGVVFRFTEQVIHVERKNGAIVGLRTPREMLRADAYVLAAGSFSWPLGKAFGIRVPVRPAKGYSITVPVEGLEPAPSLPVVDDSLHAAVVPLGGRHLRVAGTAEFAGFDRSLPAPRIDNLRNLLARIYPRLTHHKAAPEAWSGFRPMTPDGMPLLGRTRVDNLFVNTGHGPLGWTMACGSGKAVADIVLGREPGFDVSAFRLDRF